MRRVRQPAVSQGRGWVFPSKPLRRRQLEDRRSGLYLIGEEADRNVRRIAEFARRNRLPYASVPLHSPEAEASARSCSIDSRTPAVIFGSKVPITDPTRPAGDRTGRKI